MLTHTRLTRLIASGRPLSCRGLQNFCPDPQAANAELVPWPGFISTRDDFIRLHRLQAFGFGTQRLMMEEAIGFGVFRARMLSSSVCIVGKVSGVLCQASSGDYQPARLPAPAEQCIASRCRSLTGFAQAQHQISRPIEGCEAHPHWKASRCES